MKNEYGKVRRLDAVRMQNRIVSFFTLGKIPVFTLQGNFSVERLHGMYKMMMNIMVKTAGKALEKKTDRTPEEEDMLDMMLHGGERVKIQNLQGVISWYNGKR